MKNPLTYTSLGRSNQPLYSIGCERSIQGISTSISWRVCHQLGSFRLSRHGVFASTSVIMALICYDGLLKAKSARSRKDRKTCFPYLCRLCAARDSSAEGKRSDKSALAERRASNSAASSSESSSSQLFRLTTAIQCVPSPWAEEQGVPYHESLPESFHKAPSPQELDRQRSYRGTIDTAPSCIPSDINLPEQVSPYLQMSHTSPVLPALNVIFLYLAGHVRWFLSTIGRCLLIASLGLSEDSQ